MALVKYNNNSLSAVTAASSLPTGAMTLIKEQTASSSSTISFVHGTSDVVLDSTYPIYLFKFINVHPATDQKKFMFQGTTDGSNFNTTMTTSWFQAYHDEADGNTALTYVVGEDQAQGTSFQSLSEDTGNDNDQNYCGELWLYNPSSTTFVKHFMARGNDAYFSNYINNIFVAGYFNTTSAITGLQFKMESGNVDSGTFKLYGIKDS
jgi:hypothetical protein